ncbi:TIGR02588 family protein [Hansschlegelia sp.]|uniref:TIGR02588 family protein n=1 Tax=Hansschlegelia sp. TaxID=2041892 RepID=UPI002B6177FB|nr:TIGR02588 family protein [Hansschlegelia sp.]HVI28896.1 TIGR02588 family protein [Hansschlegelia sp.]
MAQGRAREKTQDDGRRDAPPPRAVGRLEWAVGALGALVTLGVLGLLGHEALTYHPAAPALTSRVTGVTKTESGYVVSFETENLGPSTAAEVVIRATLKRGDQVAEEAEATFDYVPRHSTRKAGFVLREDPAAGELELAPISYREP